MERPLVIGGTGFIGFNVVLSLVDRGYQVRATRRESSVALLLRKQKAVEKVFADLADPDSLAKAMVGRDVVFMAAGHYPRYSVDAGRNVAEAVAGVRNVLSAARRAGVRRVVYTSSVTTIGWPAKGRGSRPANEADRWANPPRDSAYFMVKEAMEAEMLSAGGGGGPEVVAVCPTGCLGEYGYKSGTGFFILALAHGLLPYWVDGPVNIVYARDAADAHVEAADRGEPGSRYILGGHDVSAGLLMREAAKRLGVDPPSEEKPLLEAHASNLALEAECARTGKGRPVIPVEFLDMMRFGQPFDSSLARRMLGLRTTPLKGILEKTIGWYEGNGFLKKSGKGGNPSINL